jgi:hypothetical protein
MAEDLYVVPTGNRKQLTVSCKSADNRPNERSLPVDLVRDVGFGQHCKPKSWFFDISSMC